MDQSVPLNNELAIELQSLKDGAQIFRAMNHNRRQSILRLLHEKGEMTVTELYTEMQMEQSVASQHLAILRNAGFVKTERVGKSILYSVNYGRIHQLHQTAAKLLGTIEP